MSDTGWGLVVGLYALLLATTIPVTVQGHPVADGPAADQGGATVSEERADDAQRLHRRVEGGA